MTEPYVFTGLLAVCNPPPSMNPTLIEEHVAHKLFKAADVELIYQIHSCVSEGSHLSFVLKNLPMLDCRITSRASSLHWKRHAVFVRMTSVH